MSEILQAVLIVRFIHYWESRIGRVLNSKESLKFIRGILAALEDPDITLGNSIPVQEQIIANILELG